MDRRWELAAGIIVGFVVLELLAQGVRWVVRRVRK